jgi:hypothetical protein
VGPEAAASVGPKAAVALGGWAEEAEALVWRSGQWRSRGAFLYLDFYMRHEHIVLPFFLLGIDWNILQ